ncbi:MAG: isochorismatase family protein [Anaerolineaceae bacterium]|nr:isochorismatase family protein [Anaerolineaceae bacterium]
MNMQENFRIHPEKAVLVVIDIQDKLAAAMPQDVLENVTRNVNMLVGMAKEFEMPILVLEQYPKALGRTIPQLQDSLGQFETIEKLVFNSLDSPEFVEKLKESSAEDVILCGMEAHICVWQTVLGLQAVDYNVFVPADAVCSRSKETWKLGLKSIRQSGALVGSTEQFLYQMVGRAGTDQFKKLLKLVK